MIAIDTNVLLRHLFQDNAEQLPKASRIIAANDQILITDIVLIETIHKPFGSLERFLGRKANV